MKVSETLQNAKEKILLEENWFPGYYRSNQDKKDLFRLRQCNCVITALELANFETGDNNYSCALRALRKAIKIIDPELYKDCEGSVSRLNDLATHEMIVKTYDVAIDISKESE